jgi:hypothetical protein
VNLQVSGALNHVLVGNDVACRIDNETGAETLQSLANLTRPNAIIAEELRVKILEWIAHSAPHYTLGINIYHCRQDLRHRQNGRFRSRIGLAKTRYRRWEDQQRSA